MATNYVQPGDYLTETAPTGGVTAGTGVLMGSIFMVPTTTASAGATFTGGTRGVWSLAKVSTEVWVVGDKVYWDDTNKRCSNVPTASMRLIGQAIEAAANPTTTGKVKLAEAPALFAGDGGAVPASYATAGPQTYTAADMLGGIIVRDTNGAGRTDTLPTAALLVAAIPGAKIGDVVSTLIINGADAAETLTLAAGSGGGFDTNQTASSRVIPQNSSKLVKVRITNVTASSEAYVVYA